MAPLRNEAAAETSGHVSMLLEFSVLSLGGVIRVKEDEKSQTEGNDGGDNRHSTPGLLGIATVKDFEEREKRRSHNELGNTSTEVTPATNQRVRSSDNILGEHTACPVLAHDECTTGGANEKTEDGKASRTVHQSSAGRGNGGTAQDDSHQDTRPVLVTHGAEEETHKDRSTNTGNGRRPDLLGGQIEIGTDLGKEGGNSEPDEKGNEETHPRAVEGTHVGTGEVTELDFLGLVILVGVDLTNVLGVLFPFFL